MKVKQISPQISIIIPVYNTGPYLKRCLESVINQSISSKEIIICDDLSTDNSRKIIEEYCDKYPFLKYHKMEKKGSAGGARNCGLRLATGKYIGFVDSDDWIDTEMYRKMIEAMERTNADVAICGVLHEFEHQFDASTRYSYSSENLINGNLAFELLTRRYNQDISISSIVCNKVYKRSNIISNNLIFLENNNHEDDHFNFICFLNINQAIIIPNCFYHYYQRQNSITHSFSKKHIDDIIFAFKKIREYLEQYDHNNDHQNNYHSFFEKCFSFVISSLVTMEPRTDIQGKYISYFMKNSKEIINSQKYFEFVGARRLKKFLLP